ncbi:MAG: hypothetical protein K6C08_15365 [Oscillospiraceae bacterium]|nr:hypothetical protein [Oscillospiraceae bacterium]
MEDGQNVRNCLSQAGFNSHENQKQDKDYADVNQENHRNLQKQSSDAIDSERSPYIQIVAGEKNH